MQQSFCFFRGLLTEAKMTAQAEQWPRIGLRAGPETLGLLRRLSQFVVGLRGDQ